MSITPSVRSVNVRRSDDVDPGRCPACGADRIVYQDPHDESPPEVICPECPVGYDLAKEAVADKRETAAIVLFYRMVLDVDAE